MTLNPMFSIYLNIAMVALIGVGGYLGANSAFMSTKAGMVTVLCIGAAVAGINGILHAIPSKAGATEQFPLGPSAPPPASPTP